MRPESWTGNNSQGGTISALSGSNVDLSLGGPLKRDHLWAFGTARIVHTNEGLSRTAAQIQLLTALKATSLLTMETSVKVFAAALSLARRDLADEGRRPRRLDRRRRGRPRRCLAEQVDEAAHADATILVRIFDRLLVAEVVALLVCD
jgi:hypothetical protein